MSSTNNSLNINSTMPLSPANGGTGISNSTHTLTVNANSTINQNVSTSASPEFSNLQLSGAQISDVNGNPIVHFTPSVSAVNYLSITNNSTGNSPTLSAVGSDTNVLLTLNGKGISGVAIQGQSDGSSAALGYVGELISSKIPLASAVSMTTSTATNITSISLSAGDWNVWGNIFFDPSSPANLNNNVGWISSSSATLPDDSLTSTVYLTVTSVDATVSALGYAVPQLPFTLSTSTTIYLGAYAVFASGTVTVCGNIFARRVR